MKRVLIIFMILAVASASFAQNKNKKERTAVDFYGIDFSAVNVIGADEMPDKFINAFERINGLLLSEPSKYDVGKYLQVEVLSINYDAAVGQLAKLKDVKFINRASSELDITNIVSNYPSSNNKGLIIIAKELNKGRNTGTFIAVIYDCNNKRIVSTKEFSGKAGGFGLRNFWAGALFRGLERAR